jgi:1-acyl-sn-glycerol-3-phosphate acyltransferase
MQHVARRLNTPFYTMASWHLFNQGLLHRCALRWMGAFSVNREGMDRQAIDEAIAILQTAERPLLIFPEGTTSRTNDWLLTLMEGPAFIARTAAKRRAKQGGKVVCHAVAIKYLFQGDVAAAVAPVLRDLEHKLTWRPQSDLPVIERIIQVGNAMLTLKELEFRVPVEAGATLRQRQTAMVNWLLHPLEIEWLGGPQSDQGIAVRIKNLRVRIFPEISHARIDPQERQRRWRQLEDTYLAQQIDCYPEHYIIALPSVDRILETVEKFEEDLTDQARIHGQLRAIIEIGKPIEVATQRERGAVEDPLITEIKTSLESMLGRLQQESRIHTNR